MKTRIIAAVMIAAFAMGEPAFAQAAAPPAAESPLNQVALAQTKLKELGLYSGAINGIRTVATKRAIRRFQAQHNLSASGALTPETISALGI